MSGGGELDKLVFKGFMNKKPPPGGSPSLSDYGYLNPGMSSDFSSILFSSPLYVISSTLSRLCFFFQHSITIYTVRLFMMGFSICLIFNFLRVI